MHADDGNALLAKLLLPIPVTRVVVNAVDSAKGPEVHDDDLALEVFPRERFAVNPFFDAFEGGGVDFHFDRLLSVNRGVH
jgi:hypothetical protein